MSNTATATATLLALLCATTTVLAAAAPLTWSACDYLVNEPQELYGYIAECARMKTPLDYSAPDGVQITLAVTRLRPTASSSAAADDEKQLWLLNGGPGDSGQGMTLLWFRNFSIAGNATGFAPPEPLFPARLGYTLYVPDHRGVGDSSFLSIPSVCTNGSFTVNLTGCLRELYALYPNDGAYLKQFTVSNAARDLNALIQAAAAPSPPRELHLAGVSYGTMWLDRFLTLFGDSVRYDTAIMDGVINPRLISFAQYTLRAGEVADKWLYSCIEDSTCAAHFPDAGGLPSALWTLYAAIEDGTSCFSRPPLSALGITTPSVLQSLIVGLTFLGSQFHTRALIPALIYRLLRCSPDDAAVWMHVFARSVDFGRVVSLYLVGENDLLGNEISVSELFLAADEPAPSLQQLWLWSNASIVADSTGVATGLLYYARDPAWPSYVPDNFTHTIATRAQRVLMVQGTLDPATMFDEAVLVEDAAMGRFLLSVPLMSHSSMAAWMAGVECPMQAVVSFLASRGASVDTSCIASMPTSIDFAGTSAYTQTAAQWWTGTSVLWD